MNHTAHARLFARALESAGVRHAVVCPGSRSTPLALALTEVEGIETRVVIDERSAAFVALGQARVTGQPSVVVCTSGSAGAHFFPAILEAERAHVPLLCVTADRPWELTAASANQTLDQEKLFGTHVRRSFQLGPPDPAALPHVPRIVAHAVSATLGPVPGAVHVNVQFRKPLEPEDSGPRTERTPRVFPPCVTASAAALSELVARVRVSERGAILAGPHLGGVEELAEPLAAFLRGSGFRLFAEVTSGLCFHPATAAHVEGDPTGLANADLVLELGAPATSLVASGRRILITPDGVPDPQSTAELVVIGDAADVFRRLPDLGRKLPQISETRPLPAGFGEPSVARTIARLVPDQSVLVIGNSSVVRDLDAFAEPRAAGVRVLHQRGLSGIDGLIAGAVGARSALPPEVVVTAVLGDVSAFHDVGSLALLADVNAPLVLCVIDNGGGRIFEALPIAKAIPEASLERLFLTPPGDAFPAVARAFGIETRVVENASELADALGAGFVSQKPLVLVVRPNARVSTEQRHTFRPGNTEKRA